MFLLIVALIVLLLLFGVATVAIVLRRPAPTPPTREEPAEALDEARQQRRHAAEVLGNELLERRVALDARRGPLQGNSSISDELDRLEMRMKAGEMSEEEFESEKVRLLGGGL